MRFPSPDPETTRAAARALARVLDGRCLVVALVGPLGAGKTLFVKGLAEGLGLDGRAVASPTFTLMNEYPVTARASDESGTGPRLRRLVHADLYRLETPGELEAAGFLDALAPGVLVAVEWADRFPEALPEDRLEVRLERRGENAREIVLRAGGPVARAALARFAEAWRAAGAPGCEGVACR